MSRIVAVLMCATLVGCAGMAERDTDVNDVTALAKCPATPNCVCSQEDAGGHRIEPLSIEGDPDTAWQRLQQTLADDASISIVAASDRYIRAEAKTRLLRFTDDVEFLLDREAGVIDMRSASRVGLSDLGKNRRRLEALRAALAAAGVVEG